MPRSEERERGFLARLINPSTWEEPAPQSDCETHTTVLLPNRPAMRSPNTVNVDTCLTLLRFNDEPVGTSSGLAYPLVRSFETWSKDEQLIRSNR